jgi:hypothetical protein
MPPKESPTPPTVLGTSWIYYRTLLYFLRTGGSFSVAWLDGPSDLRTKVHLYGLYLDLQLWDQPHYRAPTYRHDILEVRRGTCLLHEEV